MTGGDKPAHHAEAKLVGDAIAGSREAFDALVILHAPRLLALSTRMLGHAPDAQDAVQDAFAAAWLALHRFDTSRAFAPWLTTIAVNKCRDALRARRYTRMFHPDHVEEFAGLPDKGPDQERQAASSQLLSQVHREIMKLPARLKVPFVLVTLEGYSQAEAAEILGVSEKAVETRIYRARNRLKQRIDFD